MRPVFADPKTVFVFKRIFGTEEHKPLLIAFLSDVLELDEGHRIVSVELLSADQRPPVSELKLSIVDVKCRDLRGVTLRGGDARCSFVRERWGIMKKNRLNTKDQIRAVQSWLNKIFIPVPPLKETGTIDKATTQAIITFQQMKGITPADGQLDELTLGALGTELGWQANGTNFFAFELDEATNREFGDLNIDQVKFFEFHTKLFEVPSESQMSGLSTLIRFIDRDEAIDDVRWAAYMLATVKLECGNTWEPIEEYSKGRGMEYGKTVQVTDDLGVSHEHAYYGRGYPQLTWLRNYRAIGRALGMGDELVFHPERALVPGISYSTLSYGMRHGVFTGAKLSDYIHGSKRDYYNARRTINGTDRAELVSGYATKFEAILRASLY